MLAGFTVLLAPSCSKDEAADVASDLVGTWNITDVTVSITANDKDLIAYLVEDFGYDMVTANFLNDMFLDEMAGDISGTITFNKDNTYKVVTPDSEENGTWSVSDDGKKLTITETGYDPDVMTIVSLTSSTLIIGLPVETEMVDLDDVEGDETTLAVSMEMKLTK